MRASSAAIAAFAARDAQHAADLKAEPAQTEKAIAAFSALAERSMRWRPSAQGRGGVD